jgi:hypothetical protein
MNEQQGGAKAKSKITYQKSYQDTMTAKQIAQKLEGYVEVIDISKVATNTHLRYFSLRKDQQTGKIEKKFRIGGFLKKKDQADKYVILTNNTASWSVDTKKSIFYRKMKNTEVAQTYEKKMKDMKKENKRLKKDLEKLQKKYDKLKKNGTKTKSRSRSRRLVRNSPSRRGKRSKYPDSD